MRIDLAVINQGFLVGTISKPSVMKTIKGRKRRLFTVTAIDSQGAEFSIPVLSTPAICNFVPAVGERVRVSGSWRVRRFKEGGAWRVNYSLECADRRYERIDLCPPGERDLVFSALSGLTTAVRRGSLFLETSTRETRATHKAIGSHGLSLKEKGVEVHVAGPVCFGGGDVFIDLDAGGCDRAPVERGG